MRDGPDPKSNKALNNTSSATRVLSDTVVIAGVTACSYAVGYAYRIGFAEHFGVPVDLAAPTITAVLQAAAALGGVLASYFFLANLVWIVAPRHDSAIGRAIQRFVVIGIIIGFLLYAVRLKEVWAIIGGFFLLFAFFTFVFPLLTQRRAQNYEEKLAGQEKIDSQARSLYIDFANAFGRNALLLALCALLAITVAKMLGTQNAQSKEDFYALEEMGDSVVVWIDGDILVSAEYDPKTKTLTGNYTVRKVSESKPWSLRKVHVGPLQGVPKSK